MNHALNVVSFDVPFPANYGGVIDVYYKLVALKAAGVKIYLHCFTYGRQPAKELDEICEKVYYYERATGFLSNLSLLPYTVKSRQSSQLAKNLLLNDFPILFEVLHTCFLMRDPRFKNRKKIYRHSNIEHDYYSELAKSERSTTKRIYLKIEALKLRMFERILKHANLILAVNRKDCIYFNEKYPGVSTVYLPSFHPGARAGIKEGQSEYILFHGNLSISENYEAAEWLIQKVFSKINFRVVIAGLNPPEFLRDLIAQHKNIQLKESPNDEELVHLLRGAQVHVLYTAQATGLKLKLLNVLFKGRFILCNPQMLSGTDVDESNSLFICESPEDFIRKISHYYYKEFTEDLVRERCKVIEVFDNGANVRKLIELVC